MGRGQGEREARGVERVRRAREEARSGGQGDRCGGKGAVPGVSTSGLPWVGAPHTDGAPSSRPRAAGTRRAGAPPSGLLRHEARRARASAAAPHLLQARLEALAEALDGRWREGLARLVPWGLRERRGARSSQAGGERSSATALRLRRAAAGRPLPASGGQQAPALRVQNPRPVVGAGPTGQLGPGAAQGAAPERHPSSAARPLAPARGARPALTLPSAAIVVDAAHVDPVVGVARPRRVPGGRGGVVPIVRRHDLHAAGR
jgi:hypothetical protein